MEIEVACQKLKAAGIYVRSEGTWIQPIFSLGPPGQNGISIGKDTCGIFKDENSGQWILSIPIKMRMYEMPGTLESHIELILQLYSFYIVNPGKSLTSIFEEHIVHPHQYLV